MRNKGLLTASLACAVTLLGVGLVGCEDGKVVLPDPEPTKYTVTYVRGADDATGEIPAAASYAAGESVTLLPADTFSRTEYNFTYWNDGVKDYAASATYVMPAHDVVLTAKWEAKDRPPVPSEKDEPTLTELSSEFYDASKWEYMTNGDELDGGDVPYALADGSIKFHRANQAFELGDLSNGTASFMLKATNDFSLWFNSSSKDNADNYSYRLAHAYGGLRLVLSSAPEQAAAIIDGSEYKKGEWNRFDIAFSTEGNTTSVKVYINGKRAALSAGDNVAPAISVAENVLVHTRPAMFETGGYAVVKVWEAHNYVQIKPVAKAEEADLPVVACIGASITEGAGAGNFYTESYPAQLQNSLDGTYNVINFGNSGKTVRPDLPEAWLNQNQWTGVRAIVPDMAIINMGTNDSKTSNDPVCTHDSFKADYENLIDKLLEVNPDMKIYVCTVPYAYTGIWDINNDNIRNIIAPVQREIAKERGLTLIDLYEYSQNKSLLFGDGVHPNTTGYAMFVEIIEKVLADENGLTPEFIAAIDEKYNDKVSNFAATLIEDGGKIMLKVTGDTTYTEAGKIRLYVGTGDDTAQYRNATVADGKFEASVDLGTLPKGAGWYNVRVYTDTGHHIVTLDESVKTDGVPFASGDELMGNDVKATVKSWNTNWGASFSLDLTMPHVTELTAATVTEADGKIMLEISGTTTAQSLRLYIGNDEKTESYYHDVTVDNGAFTASFDLGTLTAGGGWYNVRLYYPEGSYLTVKYDEVTSGGDTLALDRTFVGTTARVTVKTWGSDKPLSLFVEPYDSSVTVNITTIEMKDGKFTVTGTVANAETLSASLFNNDTDNETVQAVIDGDTFTAEISLANLTAGNGNWYRFKLAANGGELVTYKYPNGFDTTPKHTFGDRTYRFVTDYNNTDIAIVYAAYNGPTVTLSAASIEQKTDAVTLKITGTVTDTDSRYDKTLLFIGSNADDASCYHEVEVADGAFTVTFDLATLPFGAGMQVRFYHSRNDSDAKWGYYTLKIPEVKVVEGETERALAKGDKFTVGNKSVTVGSSADWNPVELTVTDSTTVFEVTDVKFEDGYFVVSGDAQNIESLKIYLINTNVEASKTNFVAAETNDGKFTARLSLSVLADFAKTNTPFNLRYTKGDETTPVNIAQGGMSLNQKYTYGANTFTLGLNGSCVCVKYTAHTYKYAISEIEIAEADGKAVLKVKGTTQDAAIAAQDLKLKLDKTSEVKDVRIYENESEADGTFIFTVDISDILVSTKTDNSKEEGYFLRLMNDAIQIDSINSTWSDGIFKDVTIGGSTYRLYKNSTDANWYTVGICRIENA